MTRLLLLSTLGFALALSTACTPAATARVTDPVCGMDVDSAKALKTERGGKTYYFCSTDCKEKFDKDPAQYTQAKGS